MSKHVFLTEDWVNAVKGLREEFEGKVAPPAHKVRMNLVVTDVPHGDAPEAEGSAAADLVPLATR